MESFHEVYSPHTQLCLCQNLINMVTSFLDNTEATVSYEGAISKISPITNGIIRQGYDLILTLFGILLSVVLSHAFRTSDDGSAHTQDQAVRSLIKPFCKTKAKIRKIDYDTTFTSHSANSPQRMADIFADAST